MYNFLNNFETFQAHLWRALSFLGNYPYNIKQGWWHWANAETANKGIINLKQMEKLLIKFEQQKKCIEELQEYIDEL